MGRPRIDYKITVKNRFYDMVGPCVYKLFYNTRYVFVKAKNCYGSMKMIEKSLNQFMKGYESQMKQDNLYRHFFDFIKRNKDGEFRVEIYSEPDATEYQLLMLEQELVKGATKDKKCLNNIKGAYINQWNEETQMFNWLPKASVANFIRNKNRTIKKKKK